MSRLVVDGYGKFIGKRRNRIIVVEDGKTLHQVSIDKLEQVLVLGKGSISFDALGFLGINGVDLVILDWRGDVSARLSGRDMRTVSTRREQYAAYRDARSGFLAKQFVYAKIKNQYAVLGTFAKSRRGSSPELAGVLMEKRAELVELTQRILEVQVGPVECVRAELMGVEGFASSLYWAGVGEVFPMELGFLGRSGRFAVDGVNSLLNYGYAVLQGEVGRAVHLAGLDAYGGFLHADRAGRPSLVFDLMEEFRQQLVDKVVVGLVSRGMVGVEDFELRDGVCWIGDSARKLLVRGVLERFGRAVRFGGMRLKWKDVIRRQVTGVVKYLRGESDDYKGFYLRW